MKRILITGAGSYIGGCVKQRLLKEPERYQTEVLDMIPDTWRQFDFSGFDSVLHVAGIAHCKNGSADAYERVNHRLAVETAEKAKRSGVRQLIFMSSGAVYAQSDRRHKNIMVDETTELTPSTPYGVSKMRAEEDMRVLALDGQMKLAVIRPPMVYGPGAKGNYRALSVLAGKLAVFPRVNNLRSMIYIDNLCEFIRLLIDHESDGIFLPQNREYVNPSCLVAEIAASHGRAILLTSAFNWAVAIGGCLSDTVNKVFGSFCYKKTDYFQNAYQIVDFSASIARTEGNNTAIPGRPGGCERRE